MCLKLNVWMYGKVKEVTWVGKDVYVAKPKTLNNGLDEILVFSVSCGYCHPLLLEEIGTVNRILRENNCKLEQMTRRLCLMHLMADFSGFLYSSIS